MVFYFADGAMSRRAESIRKPNIYTDRAFCGALHDYGPTYEVKP